MTKILTETEESILGSLAQTRDDSKKSLADSLPDLEREYDRVVADGRKEADKISRQLTGSADLEARNAQLRIAEEAIERVFAEAASRVRAAPRDESYSGLVSSLLSEATAALGTTDVVVSTSAADRKAAESALPTFPGAELSPDERDCIGGVHVATRDGSTSFDNTLDARIERLKPLIRKEIAARFGLGG